VPCISRDVLNIDVVLIQIYIPLPKKIKIPDNLPEKMVKVMVSYMEFGWLIPLVATVEIIGGLLLITNKFRTLGAIMIFPVVIGILLTHITVAPDGLPIALILMAINLWVIIENREKYMPMIQN